MSSPIPQELEAGGPGYRGLPPSPAPSLPTTQKAAPRNLIPASEETFGKRVHAKKVSALPRKLKTISSLLQSAKVGEPREQAPMEILQTWRSSKVPELDYKPLSVDLDGIPEADQAKVKEACLDQYGRANKLFERAIGRAALRFIWKNGDPTSSEPGPLLEFSRTFSQRFLDLYRYVVKFEMQEGIPMITNAAGQLKNHGFTSQEIIALQPACVKFMDLIARIQEHFGKTKDEFELFIKLLTSSEGREELKKRDGKLLQQFIRDYIAIDSSGIDRAFFMMLTFWRADIPQVLSQLHEVASSETKTMALTAEHFRSFQTEAGPLTLEQGRLLLQSATELQVIIGDCKRYFKDDEDRLNEFITKLVFRAFSEVSDDQRLQNLIHRFQTVSNLDLLLQVIQVASEDSPSFAHIQNILCAVDKLAVVNQAWEEERLLMELRHRVGGDGSCFQTSPGSVGQNPLGYVNALVRSEGHASYEAEFRQQMYFLYMSNHFANAVMANKKLVDFVNAQLEKEHKDWRLDLIFLEAMNIRTPLNLPPIFRYGAGAQLNRLIRERTSHEMARERVSMGELHALAKGEEKGKDALGKDFCYSLSQRELLNQFGVIRVEDVPDAAQVRFSRGADTFSLLPLEHIKMGTGQEAQQKYDAAKKYLQMTRDLRIPIASGISGTLDQSFAMAGLVGIGTSKDAKERQHELQTMKLAYLAFMVPNTDHSTFEILFSAQATYGLPCRFGPSFWQDMYPEEPAFTSVLKSEVSRDVGEFPEYYLSNAYAHNVYKNLI